MSGWIDTIIGFIEANQAWAPWIILVFSIGENTAFLSIVLPSTAVLVATGALAAAGALSFTGIFLGAVVGALIGSFGSYWLGLKYGDAILRMWPVRNHPEWVTKTNQFFQKYGAATVFLGHFVTFLRPVVFLMAGMSRMSFASFALWNTLGCLVWAWAVPKVGEVGGYLIGWIWSYFTG